MLLQELTLCLSSLAVGFTRGYLLDRHSGWIVELDADSLGLAMENNLSEQSKLQTVHVDIGKAYRSDNHRMAAGDLSLLTAFSIFAPLASGVPPVDTPMIWSISALAAGLSYLTGKFVGENVSRLIRNSVDLTAQEEEDLEKRVRSFKEKALQGAPVDSDLKELSDYCLRLGLETRNSQTFRKMIYQSRDLFSYSRACNASRLFLSDDLPDYLGVVENRPSAKGNRAHALVRLGEVYYRLDLEMPLQCFYSLTESLASNESFKESSKEAHEQIIVERLPEYRLNVVVSTIDQPAMSDVVSFLHTDLADCNYKRYLISGTNHFSINETVKIVEQQFIDYLGVQIISRSDLGTERVLH
ncbi:hypothetical protein HYX12_02280 [Candidatus Woesearchaeota archaeon]|nr:hypothetical protein [Candidatus Woesearchaeota archaeon]